MFGRIVVCSDRTGTRPRQSGGNIFPQNNDSSSDDEPFSGMLRRSAIPSILFGRVQENDFPIGTLGRRGVPTLPTRRSIGYLNNDYDDDDDDDDDDDNDFSSLSDLMDMFCSTSTRYPKTRDLSDTRSAVSVRSRKPDRRRASPFDSDSMAPESQGYFEDTEKEKRGKITQKFFPGDFEPEECLYQMRCKSFLDSIDIHDAFFEPQNHTCYCKVCINKRGDQIVCERGNPPKTYALPVGWYRFGLVAPKRVHSLKAFDKWHRAYHGTVAEKIKKILDIGDIVPAGTKLMGERSELRPRPGHFTETSGPSGFNTKRIFVSPSIRYAGHEAYASPTRFTDPYTGKRTQVQVAFQVLINPDSYDVIPQTIGATSRIDYNFRNSELEWATDKHGAVILYGLLIKMS